MDTTRGSRATLDPVGELDSVAAKYEEYLVLARITEIPGIDVNGPAEVYAPRSEPLTLSIARI
ncbi:hypothetical protein [Cellulosimicrobium sp. SL-1]|uniref:hypothetical protein n=1 Tax=Cellulosimicrobium sp. SL-1 TaxID=2699423 RepID=UPI0013D48FD3|nr:hypothetical protein [Cellulosimicrobium sp. SL-1]